MTHPGQALVKLVGRLLQCGASLLFSAVIANAAALTYNSTCGASLSWEDAPAPASVNYSETGSGINSGCSATGSTLSYTFTASAGNVTASVSGSIITLSDDGSIPFGDNNTPIGSDPGCTGLPCAQLFGSFFVGVQGSFDGTYDLNGPDISDGTLTIVYLDNSHEVNCGNNGGCISAEVTQIGTNSCDANYEFAGFITCTGFNFSQPIQVSIDFMASLNSGCCALDTGSSLDASVFLTFEDATGKTLPVDLTEVPEPSSLSLLCAGLGMIAFRLKDVEHYRAYFEERIAAI